MSYCLNPHCQKPQNYQDAKFCLSCGTKLLLKERYRAIKPIGQGGFGRTLLAVDEDKPSKPPCVIKQFLSQAQGTNNSQKAAELFEQEAQRLDELGKHNQIPELLAYLIQEKSQYLVQEYIDGYNLAEILVEQGNFNEAQIWELLNSLLPVLEYVHSSEVIHRDIKPENIIRNQNKQLFLVDFGAAKVVTGTAILQDMIHGLVVLLLVLMDKLLLAVVVIKQLYFGISIQVKYLISLIILVCLLRLDPLRLAQIVK